MITQTVDTLDEVVPFTANYFENIALRNNALVSTVFGQFNTAIGQINAELAVMNGYSTATSTAAANALTYSNNAALSAATATAKANLATAVVIPTTATYSYTQQDWRQSMTSKAEFNAMAALNRNIYAGSGHIEFGKHSNSISELPVNEGINALISRANYFYMGRPLSTYGTSKTDYPVANVNGVTLNLGYINTTYLSRSEILLPPAPTVLPYDAVLTQQQIDSGVIKHADTSNSGLIVNGKFNTDTSGWTAVNGATLSLVGNAIQVTSGSVNYGAGAYQVIPTVIGKSYTVEVSCVSSTSLPNTYVRASGVTIGTFASGVGYKTFTFTATSITTDIRVEMNALSNVTVFDNIAVFPADAISRSDLPFIESWHEDVSEKDFVYPLGNVQYLGTTGDCGTPVAGAFAGSATYSLFSDTWQADSALVGKGYVWSTLSDTNKKAFTANPENNCYLDGDKVIQIRYRIRDVMGLGDNFTSYDPNLHAGLFGYSSVVQTVIKTKGKQVSLVGDYITSTYTEGVFRAVSDANVVDKTNGQYKAFSNTAESTTLAYEGKCFALPIALISRRNSGMAHPVYNPNGTAVAVDGNKWYNTATSFTSIADCFDPAKLMTASGYIGTVSGRADGIFYDQVHEGDITDLRVNSRGINDFARTIDTYMGKLQSATYRGTEGEKYTEAKVQTTTGTVATVEVNDGTKYPIGSTIYIYDLTSSAIKGRFTVKSISTNTLTVDVAFAKLANNYLISGASSTRTKSNTLTVADVIGSPTNYPSIWKTQYTLLISLHTAEDGTSLLPTGTTGSDGLAVFKLSRDANATPLQVLRSTDSGATWTALTVTTHYTFSTTTNAITFTAGNIPLTTDLIRISYQTHTNMTTATVNSEVIASGRAMAMNGSAMAHLGYSLIGKVMTASTSPYLQDGYGALGYRIDPTTLKFSTTAAEAPTHTAFMLGGMALGVPAVKTGMYITRSNGRAYLNLVFKEMKHNGTSVGDDAKFNIVDNISTTTDNNAQTVLIGQKRIELPYFISAAE